MRQDQTVQDEWVASMVVWETKGISGGRMIAAYPSVCRTPATRSNQTNSVLAVVSGKPGTLT